MEKIIVIKRDCREEEFDGRKIKNAILKAMKNGSGIIREKIAEDIAKEIEDELSGNVGGVEIATIESKVFDKLITKKQRLTAKAYEGYRTVREHQREVTNTTDGSLNELLAGDSEYWNTENSNKNPILNTTQRDYMAGIVSKDITKRFLLPPDVLYAHEEGIAHFHDEDYYAQRMHNCFHRETTFLTSEGIKKFSDFSDGDKVLVIDKNGDLRDATVKNYGKKPMVEIKFKTPCREKTVICTKDHRWILNNGEVTTNVKVGDSLMGIPNATLELDEDSMGFDECNAFSIGFLIGDGCDHNGSNNHQIRLCGDKVKYSTILEKAGYRITKITETNDLLAIKRGLRKQEFLDGKAWKYLDSKLKGYIFTGLYKADGGTKANKLCTTDERVAELIRDTSFLAGYYVTSETIEKRDTNFKKDSELIAFRFSVSQPHNQLWKVVSIEPYRSGELKDAWCIEEPITHSFMLEGAMITGNCDLVNLEDMLQNGTIISDVLIEKPHSFSTACNIATQIIAQVASSQFGGQSISLAHLAPFVDVSRQKIRKEVEEEVNLMLDGISDDWGFNYERTVDQITEKRLMKEIKKGIQTIQYQVVTLMTTNG